MQKLIAQQQTTIAYSASNAAVQKLGALPFWCTGFLLDFEIAKSDGTGPTTYQDYLFRNVTSLSITGGGYPYVSIGAPDLRILYWFWRLVSNGRGRVPDMQPGAVTLKYQLPLIFGVHKVLPNGQPNWFDNSVGIEPDSDLQISVNWAANTAMGANRTTGTGSLIRITPLGIKPTNAAEKPKFRPAWQTTQHAPTQTFSGKGDVVPLATGFRYVRSALMFLNGASPSDNRTDGYASNAVSEVGLKTSDGRFPLDVKTWDFAQMSQLNGGEGFAVADDNGAIAGATLAGGASVTGVGYNPGVGLIDYRKLGDDSIVDPQYGMNLINAATNALSQAFTVDAATNTSVVSFHETVLPY